MFSDRFIKTKTIIGILLVSGACLYCGIFGPRNHIAMRQVLARPQEYRQTTLAFQSYKIKGVSGNTLSFYELKIPYRARLEKGVWSADCKPGRGISMTGVVHDSILVVNFYHVHRYLRAKALISLFVLVGVILFITPRLWPLVRNPFKIRQQGAGHA